MKTPHQMIADMLSVQAQLNDFACPGWLKSPPAFHLAILSESAELIDAVGWKWWKKQDPKGLAQIQLEVVDIWHFVMSQIMALRNNSTTMLYELPSLVEAIGCDAPQDVYDKDLVLGAVATIPGIAYATAEDASMAKHLILGFGALWAAVRLSTKDLYRLYIGKAALNLFRWKNGYGDGSYKKDWMGEEDNVYLEKIISSTQELDVNIVMAALAARYAAVH